MYVRRTEGIYWIPRRDKKTESELDSKYERCGFLQWRERDTPLEDLRGFFEGKEVSIIAKGPSIKNLKHVPHPIICINEAAVTCAHLEPDFFCQIDSKVGTLETYAYPLVSYKIGHLYPGCRMFDPDKVAQHRLTANCAVAVAKSLGAKSFLFYGFDAYTRGDVDYAMDVDYDIGDTSRFVKHAEALIQECGDTPYKFIE